MADDDEARARVIAMAERQRLVADVRRARIAVPGALVFAAGGAGMMVLVAWVPVGLVSLVFFGLGGAMVTFLGVSLAVRALARAAIARRRLRVLDEEALPAARLVRR